MSKRILFVSHYAGRTGAPIVLLNHLLGLKANKSFAFDVLLKSEGELKSSFEKITSTYLIPSQTKNSIYQRIKNKLSGGMVYYGRFLKELLKNDYDIIYGNTVATADILVNAKKLKSRALTICHVHELEIAIKEYFGEQNFKDAIPFIDQFVAASVTVKDFITTEYGINPGKVFVYHEHVPLPDTPEKKSKDNKLRVFGSGTMDWRKGMDLFVQTACQLNKAKPDAEFEFCWIGGTKDSIDYEKATYDVKKSGTENRVKFIFSCPNPLDYLIEADLFILTSREDPFPLICLEAASLGKPIICFKNSGGMVEFVDNQNGWLVNYLDIPEVVNILAGILSDPDYKQSLQQKGYLSKLKAEQFDIEAGLKVWGKYLQNVSSESVF